MHGIIRKPLTFLLVLFCLAIVPKTPGLLAAAQFLVATENWQIERPKIGIQDAASKESDQIKTKVIVTKRSRHGEFMDVVGRFEFSSVPQGKEYQRCFWDMGMRLNGEKPGCIEQTLSPDSSGKVVTNFEMTNVSKGEWVQITIRSTDGTVQKSAKFTPFK